MVNDEVNNKAINIEIKVAQYSAKAILKAMKKIIEDANEKSQPLADYISEKRKTNSRKLCYLLCLQLLLSLLCSFLFLPISAIMVYKKLPYYYPLSVLLLRYIIS